MDSAPDIVAPRTSRDLRSGGVSKHRLSGPTWRRTSPDRYVPAQVAATTDQRIAEAAALMPPGSAIGGWAAAYADGARLFDGLDRRGRPLPVVVCLPAALHRVTIPGVRYVRQVLGDGELVDIAGTTFVSPQRTVGDLARWAPDLIEAVVAVDTMIAAGSVDLIELDAAAKRWPGRRGAKQARAAFELAQPGVRSPGESRLRLTYVVECGGSDVLVNPWVYDRNGSLLGLPDVLDEDAGLVLEYDGSRWDGAARKAGHRDVDQHREDNVREEAFERAGLIVCRADASDVGVHRRQLVRRLQSARAEGLSRDRSRDGWRVARERLPIPNTQGAKSG